MMNGEIKVLVYATIFILLILLFILAYLIIRKTLENKERSNINSKKAEMEILLFESISGGKAFELNHPDRYAIKALEELLKRFSDTFGGSFETSSLTAVADTYLTDRYKKELQSRSWSRRINTLYQIEDFKMFQLCSEVRELLQTRNLSKEEVVISIRILAAADRGEEVFRFVNGRKYNYLTDFDYRSILSKLTEESFQIFVDRFSECHPTLQWSILELVALKKDLSFLEFVEAVFKKYEGETRIRALKAISSIGFTTDIEPFYSLSHSTEWQERMLIARLIGFFPSDASYRILEDLIHDRNWWVRSQAAQSFTKLPKGREKLKALVEGSSDPYARDIASEWLYKGEV